MPLKFCHLIGARPQFIKYCPVSEAVRRVNKERLDTIQDILIHTGQHYDYDMSKVFFNELGIREPDFHLEAGSATHGKQTADILMKAEPVLKEVRPDVAVVYGDTNSTLAGALAATKLNIPVAHVEAGLRSYNRKMPEELNRILTDRIAQFLFCPSKTAAANLKKEGFHIIKSGSESSNNSGPSVYFTGDVMADVFHYAVEIARSRPGILKTLKIGPGQYALLTLHRAENTDDLEQFRKIRDFINKLAEECVVVFPVHPRVKNRLSDELKFFHPAVRQTVPCGYFDMLQLLENCCYVMTDSGGLQKEAFWARKPCITLRTETEWVETIEAGWNVLWKDYNGFSSYSKKNVQPYGDGRSADKIVNILIGCMRENGTPDLKMNSIKSTHVSGRSFG